MGQDGLADAGAVEGGGLAQDVPVGEDPHPVYGVGHVQVEHPVPVGKAEVDDLAGLAGGLHQNVVNGFGVAQVLVDDEGELQHLQPQLIPAVRQPVQIAHGGEGREDIVDIGLGDAHLLRDLRDPKDGLLGGKAGEDIQGLCQGFDLNAVFVFHRSSSLSVLYLRTPFSIWE